VLAFATIITPDADPVKRRGMLAVMDQYFVDKNNAMARTKAADSVFLSHDDVSRSSGAGQLHVWELTGRACGPGRHSCASIWAAEPGLFAVISGSGRARQLGSGCRDFARSNPCRACSPMWKAPTGHDSDFYSVYFSRGVLLEAQLIGRAKLGRRRRA